MSFKIGSNKDQKNAQKTKTCPMPNMQILNKNRI